MDIAAIPFHRLLGLAPATPPYLFQLQADEQHTNHLGTIHAAVLIAVAEASSGLFLQQHLSDGSEVIGVHLFPVIRRMEAKFHQPGRGLVQARCLLDPSSLSELRTEWRTRGRCKINVPMQVHDASGTLLLSVNYEWFIQYKAAVLT